MAPNKVATAQNKQNSNAVLVRRGITTRSQNHVIGSNVMKQATVVKDLRAKRKAEASPPKEKTTKRSALGNITNAIGKTLGAQLHEPKKIVKKASLTQLGKPLTTQTATSSIRTLDKILVKPENVKSTIDNVLPNKHTKPGLQQQQQQQQPQQQQQLQRAKVASKKVDEKVLPPSKIANVRRSLDLEKSEDSSLYVSALEEVPEESAKKCAKNSNKVEEKTKEKEKPKEEAENDKLVKETEKSSISAHLNVAPERTLPDGVQWDFDVENWLDPYQVSPYAMDIFNYLKERERLFPIDNYMDRQVCLSRWMRSLLVDWMVEVQESFELNHETLYLAVKLVDLYLTKVTVGKETLQLLGAASLFIASKFDERIPPMVDDFLYICDGAYTQRELIRMEINVLKIIDFDLGIPLSYRFLRRYARCAKVSMATLTLARFILEYSLMDYATITFSDSKMAAAALLLALQMKDLGGWTTTLEYYTGYKVDDIRDIIHVLNQGLHRKHNEALATVRNKYSHKIFFEVAKVPLKDVLNI